MLYGFLGGLLLFLPFWVVGFLGYFELSDAIFLSLYVACALSGAAAALFALLYRNRSPGQALLRMVVALPMGMLFMMKLFGRMEINRLLKNALQICKSDGFTLGASLCVVVMLYAIFGLCVLTCTALLMNKIVSNHLKKCAAPMHGNIERKSFT